MDTPIPRWLRAFFVIVAVQAFLVTPALFQPTLINIVEPWPASPLNARFIGALYTALGIAVLLCLRARAFRQVRLVTIGIVVATGTLLLITFYRLWMFGMDELALKGQFPTMWTLFYIIDPLVALYALWRFRGQDRPPAMPNPLAWLWSAEAAIFGALGLLLLVLPDLAVSFWPWAMTAPLSQLYSGHFITLAVVSAFAVGEPRWDAVRIMVVTIMTLAMLVLAVSVVHFDRFKSNPSTVIWFVFFGAEAVGLGALLWRRRAHRSPGAAVPRTGVS
ncbi:MAG: hypothetical protein U0768_05745 [Anaerolineae bacterium]